MPLLGSMDGKRNRRSESGIFLSQKRPESFWKLITAFCQMLNACDAFSFRLDLVS